MAWSRRRPRLSDVDGERGRLDRRPRRRGSWAGAVCSRQALRAVSRRRAGRRARSARARAWRARPRLRARRRLGDALGARTAWTRCAPRSRTCAAGDDGADATRDRRARGVRRRLGAHARRGSAPSRPIRAPATPPTTCAWCAARRRAPPRSRALDAYLVTVIDHGMNASTFAARVVASTGSDLVSAVVGGDRRAQGPAARRRARPGARHARRHRRRRERARAWLEAELAAGRRIMGMGHRIYRVRDPRAAVLERARRAPRGAASTGPRSRWRAPSSAAAEESLARAPPGPPAARQRRVLHRGAARRGRPAAHALHRRPSPSARVAGWCAHVAEQRAHRPPDPPVVALRRPAADHGAVIPLDSVPARARNARWGGGSRGCAERGGTGTSPLK